MDNTSLESIAVCRGAILLRKFDGIDHQKFFVVMGENEAELVGFFFINSNIHPFIWGKQALLEMQMSIKKCDYSFLSYDSYIGAQAITTIKKNIIYQEIVNRNTKIIGNLTEEDTDLLLDAVRNSKLFSAVEKATFFK